MENEYINLFASISREYAAISNRENLNSTESGFDISNGILSAIYSEFSQLAHEFDLYSLEQELERGLVDLNEKELNKAQDNASGQNTRNPNNQTNKINNVDNNDDDVTTSDIKQWSLDKIFERFLLYPNNKEKAKYRDCKAELKQILEDCDVTNRDKVIRECNFFRSIAMLLVDNIDKVFDDINHQGLSKVEIVGSGLYRMILSIGYEFDKRRFYIDDVEMDFDFLPQSQLLDTPANSIINGSLFPVDNAVSSKVDRPRILVKISRSDFRSCDDATIPPSFNDSRIIHYKADLLRARAAQVAIMSRNLSHNIGSHVLSYLYNEMDWTETPSKKDDNCGLEMIPFDDADRGLCQNVDDMFEEIDAATEGFSERHRSQKRRLEKCIRAEVESLSAVDTKNQNYIRGIRHLIAYLQERQDYVALIATQDIASVVPINFKDDIYDFLNPDKKGLRHKDKDNVDKVDNLLLHYMMRSEGIERPLFSVQEHDNEEKTSVIVKFRDFSGEDKNHVDLEAMRQWNIALPGGVMGRQAFFSILENILRNAAKHDIEQIKKADGGNLVLTIDRFDKTDYDRADESLKKVFDEYYEINNPDDDYYYVTLTLNIKVEDDTLKSLREAVCEEYIDPTTHLMKEKNKGIKEIRISAAWLRADQEPLRKVKIPDEVSGDNLEYKYSLNQRPPVLYVRKNTDGNLQYIICLLKPKQLAYIVPDETDYLPEYPKQWGWQAFRKKTYSQLRKNVFATVVVSDDADYAEVRPYSGCRCLKESELKEISVSKCATEDDRKLIMSEIYRVSANVKNDEEAIFIVDEGTRSDSVDNSVGDKIILTVDESVPENACEYFNHYTPDSSKPKALSIDQISGGNSTDRIVRRETKDILWLYRHLNALKSKIAIFDERLFDRMSKEKEFALRNYDRLTHVYTIELDDKQIGSVNIWGLDANSRAMTRVCVATITKDDKGFEVTMDNPIGTKYNYITIHQGLFDKLYDKFDIRNKVVKHQLIAAFHKAFCVQKDTEYNYKDGFLPNISVHSGRSKPSKGQIPALIPFIPYSALERAVSDCKYTLVELLYSAKVTN